MKISILSIAAGLTTAILGRHSIAALAVGFGLMLVGWAIMEGKEGKA